MRGFVAYGNRNAQTSESINGGILSDVGARYLIVQAGKHFRNTAHARAANAYKVNALNPTHHGFTC
jgi:hypothetical protein